MINCRRNSWVGGQGDGRQGISPQQRLAASSDPLVARKCCRDTVQYVPSCAILRGAASRHITPAGRLRPIYIAHNLDLTLTDGLALALHYHSDPNKEKKVGTWLSELKKITQFTKTMGEKVNRRTEREGGVVEGRKNTSSGR